MEPYQAIVVAAHQIEYLNPIKFRAGDRVGIGECDEECPGWIWTRIKSGNRGWAPASYLEISGSSGLALRDYEATELATQPGEPLRVDNEIDGWAWASNQSGISGWVPLSGIQKREPLYEQEETKRSN